MMISNTRTTADILPIAFTPDSASILVRGMSGVQVFNLDTLKEERFLKASQNILAAALSPDGETLAWNEIKNSMAITFSPDGRYLAYADIDDNSKVFLSTVDGSEIVRTMAEHQGPVWGISFSPDSQLLVSTDGTEIRIWQVEDGSLRYVGKAACP